MPRHPLLDASGTTRLQRALVGRRRGGHGKPPVHPRFQSGPERPHRDRAAGHPPPGRPGRERRMKIRRSREAPRERRGPGEIYPRHGSRRRPDNATERRRPEGTPGERWGDYHHGYHHDASSGTFRAIGSRETVTMKSRDEHSSRRERSCRDDRRELSDHDTTRDADPLRRTASVGARTEKKEMGGWRYARGGSAAGRYSGKPHECWIRGIFGVSRPRGVHCAT